MRGAILNTKKVDAEQPTRDQLPKPPFGREDTGDSLVFVFGNSEHIFGKVCGKVQDLKWKWRDPPLSDRRLTCGRRDVQEIDATPRGKIRSQHVPAENHGTAPG